ncbi:hypothetical protein TruAng_004535 [Truncatella angustata]|nr:hypothetical protein TruAng_004535 [Truncatella angustata]
MEQVQGVIDPEVSELLHRNLELAYPEQIQSIWDEFGSQERVGDVPFLPSWDVTQLDQACEWTDRYDDLGVGCCIWDDPPDQGRTIRRIPGYYPEDESESQGSTVEADDIPPDDSRSVFSGGEESPTESVDWLRFADLQSDSGPHHNQTIGPLMMSCMDRLQSLLPPEMENYRSAERRADAVQASSSQMLQAFDPRAAAAKLRKQLTANDSVLHFEEVKKSLLPRR